MNGSAVSLCPLLSGGGGGRPAYLDIGHGQNEPLRQCHLIWGTDRQNHGRAKSFRKHNPAVKLVISSFVCCLQLICEADIVGLVKNRRGKKR